jgi:tetratricopeptide (TPR) repeat protein
MKKNKFILVDLLLLGLTIALMIIFEVTFYPTSQNDPSGKIKAGSEKGNIGLFEFGDSNDQYAKVKPVKESSKTIQLFKETLDYKKSGELNSALASCNKAIAIDSTDTKGYYLRAVINTQLYRNTDAINDYSKTLKLNPDYFQAYLNRGLLFMKGRKLVIALFDFANAIKINPLKSIGFLISHSVKSIF